MRLFLTALVGFLAVLIVALLFVLEQFSEYARESVVRRWSAVADTVATDLSRSSSPADQRQRALVLMGRHDIRGLALTGPAPLRIGLPIGTNESATITRRLESGGEVRISFEDADLDAIQKRFALTAAICVAATLTGMFLLSLFIPRITRPIEEMLDEARRLGTPDGRQDETTYLLETFRQSIRRLEAQEVELKRLHETEKSRADELETVTGTLTRSLTSGLIALDPDGTVRQMNAAARETLGIDADRDVREPIAAVLGDSPLAAVIRDAITRRDTLTRIEVEHTVAGTPVAIGLTAVPLIGEGDRFLGMLALFTDLTPIKRLEARVRGMQTLADLGEMAAGIVHELRNSLATILGYVKLVQRGELPAEAARRLRAAEEEANQLRVAVDRLLTFAKPMELQLERVDVRALAEELVGRLAEHAPQVRFSIEGNGVIEGDRALLGRAIENVLRNAIDAVRERGDEGRVAVEVHNEPPAIVISDNGAGFDGARAARLMLPFVSEKPGGFGLGLSLARKIVMLHGGDIELRGAPGEGAVATLYLGARTGAPASPPALS